jgi:acyl carrier protein
MEEGMRTRALDIIGEQVGIDPLALTDNTTILQLGADSLDCIEIGLELEEEFDIELPDDALTVDTDKEAVTVGAVLKMIQERWEA